MRIPPGYLSRIRFPCALSAALCLWLGACAPSIPPGDGESVSRAGQAGGPEALRPIRFQFIYVIHGEGSYGFHDAGGRRRLADSEALVRAYEVARESADAEVFIFHQKPVPLLGFLRIADGTMRYYRNGSLLRTENYRRPEGAEAFEAEAGLYRKHAAGTGREAAPRFAARVFLYFGHGIPEESIPSFGRGLGRFAGESPSYAKPFSLVVLSSCNGGTPEAIRALSPHADRILTSPGELHLSYLDPRALTRLAREEAAPEREEAAPEREEAATADDGLAERWGRALAEESFAGLLERTGTAVTVALYDTDRAAAYLDTREQAWGSTRLQSGDANPAIAGHRDCAEIPGFGPGGPESGVTVYYRPARFGPEKGRASHSGWECRESG